MNFVKTIAIACAFVASAAYAQESFVVGIKEATVEDGIVAFKSNTLEAELWYDVNDPVLKAWRNSGQPMPGTRKVFEDENPNKCWRLTHENMDAVGVNVATGESQKGTLSAIERVNCKEKPAFPLAEVVGQYVGYVELSHMVDVDTLKKWLVPSAEADALDEKYFALTAAFKRGEISEDDYYYNSGLKIEMGRLLNYPSKGIRPVEVYIPRKLYRDAYTTYAKLYGYRNENNTGCYAIGYNTPIVVKEEFPYIEFPYVESLIPVDLSFCQRTSSVSVFNVNLPNETH